METKDKIKIKKQFDILMKGIAQDGKQALEDFYSEYGRLIYSVAVSVSKSSYLADEIVNDVLVKVWQTAKAQKDIENPLGWLFVVTTNCAKDKLKSEKPFSEIYDIPQDDKNIEALIIEEAFLSDISILNEEEQQILILYFIQHLTFKMIAEEMNKPTSTVSSIYYRALEKLKKVLE